MRNLGIVIPGLLYRSGRYALGELKRTAREFGIRRVIDLRDRPPLFVPSSYRRIGVEFINIPVGEHDALPETPNLTSSPTLLHCWKGAHRTGAVIARFRIASGWTEREAYDEMMSFGFGDIEKHIELFVSAFGEWRP